MERPAGKNAAGRQLEELRFHWGSAYDIDLAGSVCTARRRDGKGGTLADPLPEELRLRIAADYRPGPPGRGGLARGAPAGHCGGDGRRAERPVPLRLRPPCSARCSLLPTSIGPGRSPASRAAGAVR